MDLRELAGSRFGEEGKSLLDVKAASKIYSFVHSEAHVEPLLASLFWQILKSSTGYTHALQRAKASPLAAQQAETIVVAHGPSANPRYDLVVLDPGYLGDEPYAERLHDLDPADLRAGWDRWQRHVLAKLRDAAFAGYNRAAEDFQRNLRLVSALDYSFPAEALEMKRFGLIVARQPLLQSNSVPTPCWHLAPIPGGTPVSTVGAVVRDVKGRDGVTVALHSLMAAVPSAVLGTRVEISDGGTSLVGAVQSIDQVSDSAFVEIHPPFVQHPRGSKGPLRGVSPRANEQVAFEGLSSGSATATVTGWSPDLPLVLPYSQLKVFTTPATSPRDSGAALVDGDDHILGFSFYRTGIGQPIEFSAWIWADSVYAAHNLI